MRVVIRDTSKDMAEYAAKYICKKINDFKPTAEKPFVLCLPTGSTPVPVYKLLIQMYKDGDVSFEHVVTFNLDEYVGIPRDSPYSYHTFMWDNFFKHVNINPANVNILNGESVDLDVLAAECQRYEDLIIEKGGIDLLLAGLGQDGHIAFNEPGSSLSSRTRVKTLAYDTLVANAVHFGGDVSKVPHMSVTMGVGTILEAREVMVIVNGQNKAHALRECIEGSVSHMYTMSALQLHKNAVIVCDEDSTLDCRVRTIKYFKGLEATWSLSAKKE